MCTGRICGSSNAPEGRVTIPEGIGKMTSPLQLSSWVMELRNHVDMVSADYILGGIQRRFRIGFRYHTHSCWSTPQNMVSAGLHLLPMQQYFEKEVAAGRIVGPIDKEIKVHASRVGVISRPLTCLDYIMKSIKHHQAKAGTKAHTRLLITPPLLWRLKSMWAESGSERGTK